MYALCVCACESQDFLKSVQARRRYWSRSFVGFAPFSMARPNAAHLSIASLQREGCLEGGIITQNVDGLHQQAGSSQIVELHGTTRKAACLEVCGASSGHFRLIPRMKPTLVVSWWFGAA